MENQVLGAGISQTGEDALNVGTRKSLTSAPSNTLMIQLLLVELKFRSKNRSTATGESQRQCLKRSPLYT